MGEHSNRCTNFEDGAFSSYRDKSEVTTGKLNRSPSLLYPSLPNTPFLTTR